MEIWQQKSIGNDRLGYSNSNIAPELEVIRIFDQISGNTGYLKSYLDIVLWSFCADGYGEICTANSKCNRCVIREH